MVVVVTMLVSVLSQMNAATVPQWSSSIQVYPPQFCRTVMFLSDVSGDILHYVCVSGLNSLCCSCAYRLQLRFRYVEGERPA